MPATIAAAVISTGRIRVRPASRAARKALRPLTIPEYWMTWKLRWKVTVGDYTTEAGLRFLEERSPLNRADQIVRPY
jgi:hypothetical protein